MPRFNGNTPMYGGILDWFVDEDEIVGEYQALKEAVATEYTNLKHTADQAGRDIMIGLTILVGSTAITAVGIILICLILLFKK